MAISDLRLAAPKRLAHLPLILDVLRRSRVMEVIDEACGIDRRMKVSHGECVAIIIAGVFAGEHGLWRLQDRLDVYDMATVMRDPGIDLAEYHDVRLGRACDAIYHAGPDRILTALALHQIEAWELDHDYLHIDTTSLSFYGAYEHEIDPFWNPEIDGGFTLESVPEAQPLQNDVPDGDGRDSPRVVRGYAKNHRNDLKQILYGSVVSRDGGVPLYGRPLDGNTNDITVAAEFLEHLRKSMSDVQESCFVADSKGWNPRVLGQVHDHRLRLLSRLPRSTTLAQSCVETFAFETAPCRLKHYDKTRGHWSWVAYQGSDEEYSFTYKRHHRDADGTLRTEEQKIALPVRTVTCFSSELYRQKAKTVKTIQAREAKRLDKKIRQLERRTWRCEPDAAAAADRLHARQPFVTVTLSATVVEETRPGRRSKRGRPRKDEQPPVPVTTYRLQVAATPATDADIDARLRRAATYVLVRNRLPKWKISDEEMAMSYDEQWRVEHGFSWLKSGAAINPMFLETPRRIEALCMIYTIALMVHTLIQRGIRSGLKRRGWQLPYHRNKPSDKITARFLYELFRNVTTMVVGLGDEVEKRIFGMDEHTEKAVRAMNLSPDAYHPLLHDREKSS